MNRQIATRSPFIIHRSHSPTSGHRHLFRAAPFGKTFLLVSLCLFVFVRQGFAIGQAQYVENTRSEGSFPVFQNNVAATIYVDTNDFAGVVIAANNLRADVDRVTGCSPAIAHEENGLGENAILVGTIGKSRIIDRLIRDRKIDVSQITGKWESFIIQVVPEPLPGVTSGLVIVGSDKRGTIYGIYDLSEEMGVSPWYWWADVPIRHQDALFVKPGGYVQGPPAVKYRGIFLNDEAPDLSGWVQEKYGRAQGVVAANYGRQFYTNLFEVILRLRGNYLWPAMWNNAFNEDDPENPRLADEYGIVMGTSHQEPMMRAQKEWDRRYEKALGHWNYAKNPDVLENFWREGIKRNKDYENIITIGLRGANDTPMSETDNIAMLEKIVGVQRKIIADEVNPDVTKVPQLWCLYKEVQGYYDEKGMRVPDDVTLLWAEDNWGNVRRLPTAEERKRSGGTGVYYHFDFVGGPRNYKWLNTSPTAKIWEQMNLAGNYGANRIWIVNVGHFKGYELPIEFFMNLAWEPQRWPNEKISEFTRLWAEREFGPEYAAQIADILSKYTKYNGRRKSELLDPDTFSIVNYQEADRVLADWKSITAEAEGIYQKLPENARDAFFELVLYPTKACEQVNDLYITVAKNRLFAAQGRASANDFAAQARELFKADADLSAYYNSTLANGRWSHMMDQVHIGYTSWQDPPTNAMPGVDEIQIPANAEMGIAVEGSTSVWPDTTNKTVQPVLPEFDVFNRPRRYIDVFNKGKAPFEFAAVAGNPWIVLNETNGTVEKDKRLWINVDWGKAPKGKSSGAVTLTGAGDNIVVKVNAFNPTEPARDSLKGFVEADGYVSIEAEHFTKKIDARPVQWGRIPNLGRTLSAMTVFPVTASSVTPPGNSPCLEYQMYLFHPGQVEVEAIINPTLNFVAGRGLRCAVSFDDQPPQIITAVPPGFVAKDGNRDWETTVKDNVRKVKSTHKLDKPGYHTLKFWMVDPGVVLQKLVVNLGGVKPSYLGPSESYNNNIIPSVHLN